MNYFLFLRIFIHAFFPVQAAAQTIDENTCRQVSLQNGAEVRLCADANNKNAFYYLPNTLQLSYLDGMPQISLLVYKNKGSDKIAGGILHFLFQWGLTTSQEKELQTFLTSKIDTAAVLFGAADISFNNNERLNFLSQHETVAAILNSSLSQSLKVSPNASGKSAGSVRLSAEDANRIWNFFGHAASEKPVLLECTYTYPVIKYDGVIHTTIKKQGTLTAIINDWMQQAKKYDNAKIIKQ